MRMEKVIIRCRAAKIEGTRQAEMKVWLTSGDFFLAKMLIGFVASFSTCSLRRERGTKRDHDW